MLEQGPDFWCWFDTTQFSYIPLCSPNTCKDVFNPNVTTFQSNCAEGLHFSAFIIIVVVHVVKHQSVLINTCRINVPWWAILNIVYNDTMYTVFIIMSCKTILSTEVQGPSLTSEWNAAMAPSTGTVLVRALAIASLIFRFYATLHAMFQRPSCLPCVSYSSLVSAMYLP